MSRSLFIALNVTLASMALRGAEFQVKFERVLPAELARTHSVRWSGSNAVLLAAGPKGVVEYSLTSGDSRQVLDIRSHTSVPFAARVSVSDRFVVAAAPMGAVVWMARHSGAREELAAFSSPLDVDVHSDQLAILGATRDVRGRYAPEGAILWKGTLSKHLQDLTAMQFSSSGAGARNMNDCMSLELGAIRFLPDGSLVVAPGVQPGIFLYGADGHLRYTWDTSRMGFVDRCTLTTSEWQRANVDFEWRSAWINHHVVIDDVFAIGKTPAVLLRTFDGSAVSWTMVLLYANAPERRIRLPFTARSGTSHLAADTRGDRIVFLQYSRASKAAPPPARLIVGDWTP